MLTLIHIYFLGCENWRAKRTYFLLKWIDWWSSLSGNRRLDTLRLINLSFWGTFCFIKIWRMIKNFVLFPEKKMWLCWLKWTDLTPGRSLRKKEKKKKKKKKKKREGRPGHCDWTHSDRIFYSFSWNEKKMLNTNNGFFNHEKPITKEKSNYWKKKV